MNDYFDRLAALLRDRGVPAERITATIDDLAAYVQESGTDPEEELGPVADFAGRLGVEHLPEGATPAADTWTWTADIFADERRLNEFGEQGWEVERVDKKGMFVSRRDPERPQRWEYRREVVTLRGRAALVAGLAPDGWEPCGTWFHYEYFKRPKAASVGPAAEITSVTPVPSSRLYFSGRFYGFVALCLFFVAVAVAGLAQIPHNSGFTVGVAAGAVAGAGGALVASFLARRKH